MTSLMAMMVPIRFSDLTVTDDGAGNTIIYVTGDATNTILLTNADFTTIGADGFIFV